MQRGAALTDVLRREARRKQRNIINICGRKMSSSACAKSTFVFPRIYITPSATSTGSSAWSLRDSAEWLAEDCRRWCGCRGWILRRAAGARGRAGGDDRTSGVCRSCKEERTFPRHVAISRECASRGVYGTKRGSRRGDCPVLRENDRQRNDGARAGSAALSRRVGAQPAKRRGQRGTDSRRGSDRSDPGRRLRRGFGHRSRDVNDGRGDLVVGPE